MGVRNRKGAIDAKIIIFSPRLPNPSTAKRMQRHSKLTLRVTEAASAVCGITFHPNGMDGGLTTVTLTLLLYTTLPRLTGLSEAGGVRLPTFTVSPVFPKTQPSANPEDMIMMGI